MKSILKFTCVCFLCIILLSSCFFKSDRVMKNGESDKHLYLVVGFDDAAENTDVIFTMGYDKSQNLVSVAQIPRDTYYNFGGAQNKINQLYSSLRNKGEDSHAAMQKMTKEISYLFGTEFDGFIGITTDTFRKIVDGLGGVDIELSRDMTVYLDGDEPVVLKAGTNTINGEIAERFVRYRKGYAMGDIGRLDAQKMFLNALFAKASSGLTLPSLLSVASAIQSSAVTDMGLSDVVSLIMSSVTQKDTARSVFATVPGEPAINSNGLSYYVLNRKSAAEIAKRYMFATNEFDKDYKCRNASEQAFMNIYDDDSLVIREYYNEEIKDMHIPSAKPSAAFGIVYTEEYYDRGKNSRAFRRDLA